METKQCSKCKKTKPLEEFNQSVASADGHISQCKQCIKKRNAQYYANNRDYYRQYYVDHGEKIREHSVQQRADNPDYHRQYYIDNADKYRAYEANRRASKIAAEGTFTDEQFTTLCEQYGNRCLCCGEVKKLTVDHIVPLSKGGSNDISNLQGLCGPCNSKKHTQTIDYRGAK